MDIPADIRREGRVVGLNVHGAVPARSCRNGFFWPNHMGGQALLWEIFRIQWDNEISVASL